MTSRSVPETENVADAPPAPRGTPLEPRDRTSAELGRHIKMLRVARGLTLKDVETRGGISATHVSEIERGKASPTVGALSRIATALDMRPAALVAPRLLPEAVVNRADERTTESMQWGSAAIHPVTGATQDATLGVHVFTLPIAREPVLSHRHDGEEFVTVLAGVAEIRVDGKSHVLREGDSMHFHGVRPHSYSNLGSMPAQLLIANRPRLSV